MSDSQAPNGPILFSTEWSPPPVDENAASSRWYEASDTSITSAITPMAMTALSRSPRDTAAVNRFWGLVRSYVVSAICPLCTCRGSY
jgi:hypothetical protein